MTEEQLKATLQHLESELRKIPGWLRVVLIMSEINKIKTQLSEIKQLEYHEDGSSS